MPVGSSVIGLLTADGEPEGRSGTTHLYRRWFDLEAPAPGTYIVSATLEMWSDNRSEWWWQGKPLRGDVQNRQNRRTYVFGEGEISSEGGRYLLAIQNGNDYVCTAPPDTCNAHGTAFCLRVEWCTVTPAP